MAFGNENCPESITFDTLCVYFIVHVNESYEFLLSIMLSQWLMNRIQADVKPSRYVLTNIIPLYSV